MSTTKTRTRATTVLGTLTSDPTRNARVDAELAGLIAAGLDYALKMSEGDNDGMCLDGRQRKLLAKLASRFEGIAEDLDDTDSH